MLRIHKTEDGVALSPTTIDHDKQGGLIMVSFSSAWAISSVVLVGLAIAIGRTATGRWTGVLIDGRGRYSLTHLQTVTWTLAILSTYVAGLVSSSFAEAKLPIDDSLLQLMGVVAGSAVLAVGVKGIKDTPGSGAGQIARDKAVIDRPDATQVTITPKLSQIWLEEEGSLADEVVSITKFQNFFFTLVALGVYIALTSKDQVLPASLPENFVWLLGISHLGYVGGKVPNRAK
jgi:hypothetical protein